MVARGAAGLNIRVSDSVRLPVLGSDIERESVDAAALSLVDIVRPCCLCVRVGVADYVMRKDVFRACTRFNLRGCMRSCVEAERKGGE